MIFSTVASTTTTPSAINQTAQSWILRPSRKTSLSIVSGATGTGRIRSTVTRAIRIGTGVGMRSTAHTTNAAGGEPCCMLGCHGPAAYGLVTTWLPSTRKMASISEGSCRSNERHAAVEDDGLAGHVLVTEHHRDGLRHFLRLAHAAERDIVGKVSAALHHVGLDQRRRHVVDGDALFDEPGGIASG